MADLGNLIPLDEQPDDPTETLEQFELALDDPRLFGDGSEDDITIAVQSAPVQLGRSWAFDFEALKMVLAPNGLSPLAISGRSTLRQWVMKALLTERGSCAVHSDAYGLERPFEPIGSMLDHAMQEQYAERVREALMLHPKIRDVVDFSWDTDDDDSVIVAFRVVLDDEDDLSIGGVVLR